MVVRPSGCRGVDAPDSVRPMNDWLDHWWDHGGDRWRESTLCFYFAAVFILPGIPVLIVRRVFGR